uniref:Uncharacterized protein n=1 Tax=Rangifer tarandus platyrhynchus TaxID=3082113 RepID=A0ACB0F4V2_RANTA|nr:unnamed protein product [Rangifer tarandus platyrhynchus]
MRFENHRISASAPHRVTGRGRPVRPPEEEWRLGELGEAVLSGRSGRQSGCGPPGVTGAAAGAETVGGRVPAVLSPGLMDGTCWICPEACGPGVPLLSGWGPRSRRYRMPVPQDVKLRNTRGCSLAVKRIVAGCDDLAAFPLPVTGPRLCVSLLSRGPCSWAGCRSQSLFCAFWGLPH